MDLADLELAVEDAVTAGLEGAAILDGNGKALAIAGALDADEARALTAHATRDAKSAELRERLLRGEPLEATLGDRLARIALVARCVFVVVVLTRERADVAADLRARVKQLIRDARAAASVSTTGGSGGSSSGPAELPVIELGITVRRPS